MAAHVYGSSNVIVDELEEINETLEDIYEQGGIGGGNPGSGIGAVGEVTVTNVSTVIRNANPDRKAVTIRNIGTVIVYITSGASANLQGFPVDPGGVLEFEGYFGPITGITAATASAVRFMEII